MAQRMCVLSRKEAEPYVDSVVGRAVLTIAYTTGTRVGGLLPPCNRERAEKFSPITRRNIREVNSTTSRNPNQKPIEKEKDG